MPRFNFILFTAGVIILADGYTFDYETTANFYLTVSVRDEYLPAILSQVLTINVNDLNEEPALSLFTTQITTQEGDVWLLLQLLYVFHYENTPIQMYRKFHL